MRVTDNHNNSQGIIICIPIFNDWESVLVLIEQLDKEASRINEAVSVLLVDDGSCELGPEVFPNTLTNISKVEVIRLRRNLGHQRAIALGLSFIHAKLPCRAVVVMDGDGEDDPKDVKNLIEYCRNKNFSKIIFAKRSKRSERFLFRLGYQCYKILHYFLTGLRVEVGNFSIIPFEFLNQLIVVSELWNHYAAAVFLAKLPLEMTPIPRGIRIAGKSSMNFISLVVHGMSAISVFGDRVGVRLLCMAGLLMLLTSSGLVVTVSIKYFTDLAIPGWATNLTGILSIIFLSLFFVTIFSVILMLNSRDRLTFLPIRDWEYFVDYYKTIYC